jgi:hypothetical protein
MAPASRVHSARLLIRAACLPVLALSCHSTGLLADTLVSGEARLDLDESAWGSLASGLGAAVPVLRLDAFFDQAAANARNYDQILADPLPATSYSGLVLVMNGPTVTNQTGRTTQPTTFEYSPGDLNSHTGSIGLGGIVRFKVSSGGGLLYGDYTLLYSTARHRFGGSGWHLKGNIAPSVANFDLLNVQLTEHPDGFTLSGDLAVSFEIANFLYATPADALRDVGDFTFTGRSSVRPQPPVLTGPENSGDSPRIRISEGTPGSAFTLVASPDFALPLAGWSAVASGTLDASGNASVAIEVSASVTARYFRVIQP